MNTTNVATRNEVVPALEFVTVWTNSADLEAFLKETGMTPATAKARAKSLRKGGTNLPELIGESGKGRKLDVAKLNAAIAKLAADKAAASSESAS